MKKQEILKVLRDEANKPKDKTTAFRRGQSSGKMEAYTYAFFLVEQLTIPDVSEILEFAKREKRIAEGSSEECVQECDNEEQSLIYTGQAQAYEELITYLTFKNMKH